MSLIGKANTRFLIPADSYVCRCYAVVDFGTQITSYKGQNKPAPQVYLAWELPELRMEIERDGGKLEVPRVKGARFTNSLHSKAKLRKLLDVWRGRPFTDDELKGFDYSKLLGAPGLMTITHSSGDDGTVYDNVASVIKLPKTMPEPRAETPQLKFELPSEPPVSFPANMPDWMRDVVTQSVECRRWGGVGEAQHDDGAHETHDDGDLPF